MNKINLIVLTPHGRAGSYFIQSIFDGCEQVITMPGYRYNGRLWRKLLTRSPEQIAKQLADDIFKSQLKTISFEKVEGIKKAFEFKLKNQLECKNKLGLDDLLITAHTTYAELMGVRTESIKYILLHTYPYEGEHENLFSQFKDAKFIAIFRDPRENWLSYRSFYLKTYKIFKNIALKIQFIRHNEMYNRSIYDFIKLTNGIKIKNLFLLDLEKTHTNSESIMNKLCSWLEIAKEKSMEKSTVGQEVWGGNLTSGKQLTTFDPNRSLQYKNILSNFDIDFIGNDALEFINALKYEAPTHRLNKIRISYLFCLLPVIDLINGHRSTKTYFNVYKNKISWLILVILEFLILIPINIIYELLNIRILINKFYKKNVSNLILISKKCMILE